MRTCYVCIGWYKCMKYKDIVNFSHQENLNQNSVGTNITHKKTEIVTNQSKDAIKQMLKEWLLNIQQNNPLPYEITNIYFIVDFSNNDIELSYSASDIDLQVIDYGFYQPLEAEYFYCEQLKQIAKDMHQKKSKLTKQQILLFLNDLCMSVWISLDFLKNKNIVFGERFNVIK